MIEYEIRFKLPENIANVFDATRRNSYIQRQIAGFISDLVSNEVEFVTDREVSKITPTINRVEPVVEL